MNVRMLAVPMALALAARTSGQVFDRDFAGPPSSRFGEALGPIVDLDLDAYDEALVGAPGFDSVLGADVGAVFIYSGSSLIQALVVSNPPPQVLLSLEGEHLGDQFGRSVSAAREDFDGDGFDELLVGAPGFDGAAGTDCGAVYVISGQWLSLTAQNLPAGPSGVLTIIEGTTAGEEFGHALDGNGDANADGVCDIVVGAPSYGSVGRVYVLSGAWLAALVTGGVLPTKTLWADSPGIGAGRRCGWDVNWIGDFDQDLHDDLVLGIPNDSAGKNNGGSARIFSGANFGQISQLFPDSAIGDCGISVAGVGDLNGDQVPDALMGAPWESPTVSPCGSTCCWFSGLVFVFHGPTTWPPAVVWNAPYTIQTPGYSAACNGAHMGNSVSGAGDFNGDGVNDAVLGQWHGKENGNDSGVVAVVRDVGQFGQLIRKWVGAANDLLGSTVADAGDIDGDGYADVLAAAAGGGYVKFIAGHPDACNGTVTIDCNANGIQDACDIALGTSVDTNLDGVPDECQCLSTIYCTAKTNSLGCVPSITCTGSPTLTGPDNFHVTASNELSNKSGLMFWSRTVFGTPFLGGYLCVKPPLVRTTVQNSGGTPPCAGAYDFHFDQALMQSHGLVAGDHVYCQYWARDPGFAFPDDVSLSDGLEFVLLP